MKIVLARDLVSAALMENLKPETVLKVGDRVAVDATDSRQQIARRDRKQILNQRQTDRKTKRIDLWK